MSDSMVHDPEGGRGGARKETNPKDSLVVDNDDDDDDDGWRC